MISCFNNNKQKKKKTMKEQENERNSKVGKIFCMPNWILIYYEIQIVAAMLRTKSNKTTNNRAVKLSSTNTYSSFVYTIYLQTAKVLDGKIFIRVQRTRRMGNKTIINLVWADIQFHSFLTRVFVCFWPTSY